MSTDLLPPDPNPNLQWQDENGVLRCLALTDKIFLGRVCRGIESDKCILVRNPMVSRDHAVVRLEIDTI